MAVTGYPSNSASHRLLLMPAFLAGEFDAGLVLFRVDLVQCPAFSAFGFNSGRALFDGDRLALHRFFDEAFGFFTHCLF